MICTIGCEKECAMISLHTTIAGIIIAVLGAYIIVSYLWRREKNENT